MRVAAKVPSDQQLCFEHKQVSLGIPNETCWRVYCTELATEEKTLFALLPTRRIVPTTILEKAELFGATHAFHFVQLLLDRMQPRLNLSLVHPASGEPIKASIKCVVNVLIGFLLVTHSFSLGNQPLCAQVEAC